MIHRNVKWVMSKAAQKLLYICQERRRGQIREVSRPESELRGSWNAVVRSQNFLKIF